MQFDLPFEQPLRELARRITELQQQPAPHRQKQLEHLMTELAAATQRLYSNLSPWQTVQVARHKLRPYTRDYIQHICEEFYELRGDRLQSNDQAILAGLANLDETTVMLIGHQKGRSPQEKQACNLGMPHPAGYRKAYRLMRLAEKFRFPLVCLIDTPGAFPGLEDEANGQAGAIAANLALMSALCIPILAVVIGEGGSGGALAISLADRILMLEHSIYTVAAPEAAASILWRDNAFAPDAAEAMKIRARDLLALHLIDDIVPEPLGGAHQDHAAAARHLKAALLKHLAELRAVPIDTLVKQRYAKYRLIRPITTP
ncbi:acetyl-CoA carboxylase carboxyl transferase subunit alpha [Thermosporothrix hazakensis]|jgi:acetyl-CoA carboxylase carboxyl transferase subunit alpha|uniref:Acetyl-coenzyme A carboxylase carboxyl transferase subunit alpha n=1 Tax=Thermosporothrix hazakensis TaxID=644383 RepID=A0A326TRZ3_THEHA|nr:acetyl-CoA carboxylase carboxyltransferase subunit alpha [Thermosporothrix hazakensis]PZW18315.1 acetyl-CoA carboxylase carboxyl transferase subunit alpha [Thermosporothrix hazakensis]GCE51441.1 acetyl-coenzyme A carboxylase carboxyl transferase subunit alpha [Thermosporothrix hazakensis]